MANISIHAPPRGATGRGVRDGRGVCISIHAPPRGATTAWRLTWSSGSDFNSRPSARGDGTRYAVHGANERFQFTPLREGRPHGVAAMQRRGIFQFTLLREGRRLTGVPLSTLTLFQFTPLREGRHRLDYSGGQCRRYFNSRPSARGDYFSKSHIPAFCYFNSRPSARGDGSVGAKSQLFIPFQFTPLREGRQEPGDHYMHFPIISIHSPPRGATLHLL